ncbi:MAG: hypothetical protein V9E93_05840 [Steroidobacteraceae bacterium]|nr:hypothetical protein [Steroidobacteraceae bacterium]MBP7015464.1 hypothetical protein [Steroidobacteraceae bacterium]
MRYVYKALRRKSRCGLRKYKTESAPRGTLCCKQVDCHLVSPLRDEWCHQPQRPRLAPGFFCACRLTLTELDPLAAACDRAVDATRATEASRLPALGMIDNDTAWL